MPTWTITEPQAVPLDTLDETAPVRRVDVRVIAGRVTVVGSEGPPRVEIGEHAGAPLTVSYEGGTLSVQHEDV
jgi:hypothetical protein